MVRQAQRRCRWVIWWSSMAFFATLTSAKAITSSHDEVMANKTTVIGLDDINSEDRTFKFVTELGSLTTFKQHVQAELKNVPTLKRKMMVKWITRKLMRPESDETKVRKMMNDLKKVLPKGPDLARAQLERWKQSGVSDKEIMTKMLKSDKNGNNILTDPSLLATWLNYARDKFEGPLDDTLYNLLKEQDDIKQIAEFAVTPQQHWLLVDVHELFNENWLKDLKTSGMKPEDFYARLKLNEKPGPLENPLLSLWVKYVNMEDYHTWLFDQAMNFYGEKSLVHVLAKGENIRDEANIDLMTIDLFRKWRVERKNSDDITKLLQQDKTLTENDRTLFMERYG